MATLPEMRGLLAGLRHDAGIDMARATIDEYAAAVTAAERLAKALGEVARPRDPFEAEPEYREVAAYEAAIALLDELYPNWREEA